MQDHIDSVVAALDHLDPILGYDVLFATGIRPVDEGMLSVIYDDCLERTNVHGQGPLRSKWLTVLDGLSGIQQANQIYGSQV